MRDTTKALLAGIGGVTAAFLGSLCCAGPLIFVTLGVGAGLASTFEPLRSIFGVLMLALLAIGFYAVYGRRPAEWPPAIASASASGDQTCTTGPACDTPRRRRRDVALLWTATAIALVFWTFPTWSRLFI